MTRRALRSRSLKRKKVRTTSKVSVHYKKAKPSAAHCAKCGAVLKGVPRQRKMSKIPKTLKRPERPFGGKLCSKCTRLLMKERAKSLE